MSEENYYDYGLGYQRGFDDATAAYENREKALTDKLVGKEPYAEIKRLEAEVLRLTQECCRLHADAAEHQDLIREIKHALEGVEL